MYGQPQVEGSSQSHNGKRAEKKQQKAELYEPLPPAQVGFGSPVAVLHEDPERRCGPRRLPAGAQDVDAQQEAHGERGQHQPPLQRHAR